MRREIEWRSVDRNRMENWGIREESKEKRERKKGGKNKKKDGKDHRI